MRKRKTPASERPQKDWASVLTAMEFTRVLALAKRRNGSVLQINDDQVLVLLRAAAELAEGTKAKEGKDLLGSVLAQRQNLLEAGVIKHKRLLVVVYAQTRVSTK